MHAHVVSCHRASGISAGCYFKSCQSPVIAPVFQWPEQDIVESSTEEGKHARVVSLPGERCTLNEETTNYGRVHRAPPTTPPPDSMSLPEIFLA